MNPLRLGWLAVTLAGCLPNLASASKDSVECVVRCARGNDCRVQAQGKAVEVGVSGITIGGCPAAELKAGTLLEGLVRTTTGVKRFSINKEQVNLSFDRVNTQLFANASCLGTLPACAESRDQARTAAAAGKGIATIKFNRQAEPCAMGLPCGSVMRPSAAQEVRLRGFAQGRLRLTAIGAGTPARDWPVEQGVLRLDATAMSAGTAYAYSLFDTSGKEVAAGGFEVLSTKMQADVQAELDRVKAADEGAAALQRLEILLDSELLWDASRQP